MNIIEKCKLTTKYIDENFNYLMNYFNEIVNIDEVLCQDIENEDKAFYEMLSKLQNNDEEDLLYRYGGAVTIKEFKRGFLTAILLRDVIL